MITIRFPYGPGECLMCGHAAIIREIHIPIAIIKSDLKKSKTKTITLKNYTFVEQCKHCGNVITKEVK